MKIGDKKEDISLENEIKRLTDHLADTRKANVERTETPPYSYINLDEIYEDLL